MHRPEKDQPQRNEVQSTLNTACSFPFEFGIGGADIASVGLVEERPMRSLAFERKRTDGVLQKPAIGKERTHGIPKCREIARLCFKSARK